MKAQKLEGMKPELFTAFKPEDVRAVGGSTIFMTLQITFITPTLSDRFFDEKSDL